MTDRQTMIKLYREAGTLLSRVSHLLIEIRNGRHSTTWENHPDYEQLSRIYGKAFMREQRRRWKALMS
jgi:hypothetical protein